MGLSSSDLSTKIQNALTGAFGTPADAATLKKFADAIAQAVVQEIVTNAVVTVTSVTGVTSGAGTSGPGTGTVS